MPNSPVFGDKQPDSIYVHGIHHVFGHFVKLEFVVFDVDKQQVMSGNETIEGADYQAWDKNDALYPYQYVCQKRGMELVVPEPAPGE